VKQEDLGTVDRPRLLGVIRREVIGPPDCPILHRWTLLNLGERVGKLLLHRFYPNADDRAVHDHPRGFITVVLRGGYDDLVPCLFCGGTGCRPEGATFASVLPPDEGVEPPWPSPLWRRCTACRAGLVRGDKMRAGSIAYRPAHHRHRTRVLPEGCWTVVVMGPLRQPWGFFMGGRKWEWEEFERRFGFGMRCGDEDADVRTRR
jgi:hypothetical protein